MGLSAFYISLLAIMCGFLGAMVVNSSVDAALGYATTEVGPSGGSDCPSHQPLADAAREVVHRLVVVPILSGVFCWWRSGS